MTDAGWEPFEVEADVGVRAWGRTRAEAFAQVALGVFALIVDPAAVEPAETREVRAQGSGPETLLVNWINECLYVHEIEGFVVHRVEVSTCTDTVAQGILVGEPLDVARHPAGTVVKAATMHGVAVAETGGRHAVRVVVDV
ncbi:MAG TPA: archease [Candidatus Tectomicrobia bacterium]|nr:archease [Candidatus Tectomicrobia bacterium]